MLTDAEKTEVGNILEDCTVNPKTLAWLCCKLLELNRELESLQDCEDSCIVDNQP